MHFRTRAIHVGQPPDPQTGAVVPPIYLAATYVQPAVGQWGPYDYSRSGNPTRKVFETTLADLEGGCAALAFSSGMAAIHAVMMLLEPGDHVLASWDLYGGTYRLLQRILSRQGIQATFAPSDDLERFAEALRPNTRLIWIETPGNPLLSITDIAACAELAHRHGALLGVDSTFATPVLTRPLELGADIVMHSATKYLGGHSDVLGGVLAVRDPALWERLWTIQNATGGVMAPLEAFLCSRGLKTLELRVREQCGTALVLARRLAEHPRVRRVYYPGLPSHPGHPIACRQMDGGFGAMISFELDASAEQAKQFVQSTRIIQLAVSLGAVESLIELPAFMSHASYEPAQRAARGITDTLVRLSVGLEHPDDLWEDLSQALAHV
jgi:cystathionine gamma-lyase